MARHGAQSLSKRQISSWWQDAERANFIAEKSTVESENETSFYGRDLLVHCFYLFV